MSQMFKSRDPQLVRTIESFSLGRSHSVRKDEGRLFYGLIRRVGAAYLEITG